MAKQSPKTKPMLIEENTKLKEALLMLKNNIKALKEESKDELTAQITLPFLDDETNSFKSMNFRFNPVTGQGKGDVDSIKDLNIIPKSPEMAMQSGKEIIVKYINVLIDQFLENRNRSDK